MLRLAGQDYSSMCQWGHPLVGDTGQQAFIIWSSGDKMKDINNTNQIVQAAQGGGNNWLEIGNAMGLGHQTYGIDRQVMTHAGATYNLSLDYAGRLGYGTDFTTIGIYVDGVKIATYANTSPDTALNWQKLSFSFIGTGATQDIQIVTEAVSSQSNGRGAMIDNLALQEVLPIDTGYQDNPINLKNIVASPHETNGSDILSVMVGAIPVGSVLTDGTNRFTATGTQTTATVTNWNLSTLTITPPSGYTGAFSLSVTARCTELATGQTADTTVLLPVTVVPNTVTSPLVIDLTGNGIQTTVLANSQGKFDLLNTGNPINSGWISSQDGFLALDNGTGRIDNLNGLFGGNIGEGYAKLAKLDTDHDGIIDANDPAYKQLRIWQDANGNHQVDPGELHSLDYYGIKSLGVDYTIVPQVQNGNWLLERSKVTFNDGHTTDMADAYFAIDPKSQAAGKGTAEAKATPQQPQIQGIPQGVESVQSQLGTTAAQAITQQLEEQRQWNSAQTPGDTSTDNTKKKHKAKPKHDDSGWLTDFLGVKEKETNIAEATGLNVTTPTTEEPKQPFVERRRTERG